MAGIRQHYIPRFLLKGFTSKEQKKEKYTYVFPKDGRPYETNQKNIGIEKNFYTTTTDHETDDIITKEENTHSQFLDELREARQSESVDPIKSSAFIAHILSRLKYFRESTEEIQTVLLKAFQKALHGKTIYDFIQTNKEMVVNELKRIFPPNVDIVKRDLLIHLYINGYIKLPNAPPSDMEASLFNPIEEVIKSSPKMAKKNHNRILKKEFEIQKFLGPVEKFKWENIYFKDHGLIFGDVGPIGLFKNQTKYKALFFERGQFTQISIPISRNHLLIGNSLAINRPIPNFNFINESIASLIPLILQDGTNPRPVGQPMECRLVCRHFR